MDRQAITTELTGIIGDYLKSQGLDLVELKYHYEGRDLFLRILTDKPAGGITLGECAQLNTRISQILDEREILNARYILEVSSPGLDRPLKTKNDFLRCLDRKARVFLKEELEGRMELEGRIAKVENDSVHINSGENIITIPLVKINKAKQLLD